MKFEEFLQANRGRVQHDAPKEKMWRHIESRVDERKPSFWNLNGWKLVSLLIVLLSILVVFKKSNSGEVDTKESESLKIQMAKLAQGEKTSERILAVSMLDEERVENEEIVQILIERMQLDESRNVRLAAVRALSRYIDNEHVRVAMLDELATVKDPYLQSKLIAALKHYKANGGTQQWDDLLDNKSKESAQFEYVIKDL